MPLITPQGMADAYNKWKTKPKKPLTAGSPAPKPAGATGVGVGVGPRPSAGMVSGPTSAPPPGRDAVTQGANILPTAPTQEQLTGALPGTNEMIVFYEALLKEHDKGWGDTQKMLQGQMAAGQRRADILNARLGRSVAGGYSSLQGGAMIGGMQEMGKAKLQSDEQRRGILLDWMEKNIEEKHRKEERGWTEEDNSKQAIWDFINAQIAAGEDVNWAAIESMVRGDDVDLDTLVGQAADKQDSENSDKETASLAYLTGTLGISEEEARKLLESWNR
jgi:hypothetical protein